MRWVRARVRAALEPGSDGGSAVIEFLGITLILLVPTVYLVLVLGRIQ
ncbi:MAG: pilus assembly protein, partial [Actinomycetales bacterium]|nr:pilus assembly protein [Actinomycetales bacterium]